MEKGKGRISFFEAPISNTKPWGELSLGEVHRLITGEKYKARTGHLRALADKGEARKYKAANFDYCTFSGVFALRANHALVEHSGLLCMDLDHLSDVAEMKKRLLADPLFDTQLLFVSPSGDGLKWVFPIDLSRASHEDYLDVYKRQGYPRKGGIVPGNDLPIVRYPFPPTVNWIFPAPDTPQLRFYDAVLKAELLRVELTLHRFSERRCV